MDIDGCAFCTAAAARGVVSSDTMITSGGREKELLFVQCESQPVQIVARPASGSDTESGALSALVSFTTSSLPLFVAESSDVPKQDVQDKSPVEPTGPIKAHNGIKRACE